MRPPVRRETSLRCCGLRAAVTQFKVKSAGVVYEVDPSVGRVCQAVRAWSSGSFTSSMLLVWSTGNASRIAQYHDLLIYLNGTLAFVLFVWVVTLILII